MIFSTILVACNSVRTKLCSKSFELENDCLIDRVQCLADFKKDPDTCRDCQELEDFYTHHCGRY